MLELAGQKLGSNSWSEWSYL